MERKLTTAVVTALLMFAGLVSVASAQTEGKTFAGNWVLDKSKSELPPMMQNLESLTMVVTQDAAQITREIKLPGGAMSGPGGGQGGGRGGRMMGGGQPATFKLDGSESVVEGPRGKTTHKVKLLNDGKVLEVSSVMTLDFQGETRTIPSSERWELIEGGAALKVWQKRETPNGAMESTMVYRRS